jgi:hypothetical protein
MRSWILAALLLASCGGSGPSALGVTGTVRDARGLVSCTWLVDADDGTTYEPLAALPANVQHNGTRIAADVTIPKGYASACMAGTIAEFTNVRPLNQ